MAALTKDRNTPARAGEVITGVPVAGAAKIYAGAMVVMDGGYAKAAVKEAGKLVLGRAEEFVDNTGGMAGDLKITVRRGVFRWENAAGNNAAAAGDIGKSEYIADDQTVTKTAAGSTAVGKILGVDDDGVWVVTG